MFGLIGHSTSFEDAKRKALDLGYDHIAEGDLAEGETEYPMEYIDKNLDNENAFFSK